MPNIGYINGQFIPLEEVRIAADDRGFQFGDGVYEVIRTYGGQPFQLDKHLARLEESAEAIHLPLPYKKTEWKDLIAEAVRRGGYSESKVYVQVTRGVAPREHLFPNHPCPTVLITVREMFGLDPSLFEHGVSVITVEDLRWGRCDIKSLNLLPNVLAKQQAKEAGAFESIFIRDGFVTDGSHSNIMMVNRGALRTPPLGPYLLAGVTRDIVLDLARHERVPVREEAIGPAALCDAEEIFLTGTTIDILPVVRLDEKLVGSGQPGQVTTALASRFKMFVAECRSS